LAYGRHHPGKDAPADGDDHGVRQREVHERAVAEDPPVAAADRLGTRRLAHDCNEDRDVGEVSRGVEQEQRHEAREAEAGHESAECAAESEARVRADPRDRACAVANVRRREHCNQRRLRRKQSAVPRAAEGCGRECQRLRLRKGEPGITRGERDAGTNGRGSRAEPVD
jgi:hypothetical protein